MNPFYPLLLSGLIAASAVPAAAEGAPSPAERRKAVLAAEGAESLPLLEAAMSDENAVVRRAAARALDRQGAFDPLRKALKEDADPLVRRTALSALLLKLPDGERGPVFEAGVADPNETVRLMTVEFLVAQQPRDEAVKALLNRARGDASPVIAKLAADSMWPFHRVNVPTREMAEFQDIPLNLVQTIPIEKEGWKFRHDRSQRGHEQGWFAPEAAEAGWADVAIEQSWSTYGDMVHGVAWYRKLFTLPAKPQMEGVDLVFEAVDEAAWVWLNGVYVGQHNEGPGGWNKRFAMEVAENLNWGGENQLTVRVAKDSGLHAGIWKPVLLEVFKR